MPYQKSFLPLGETPFCLSDDESSKQATKISRSAILRNSDLPKNDVRRYDEKRNERDLQLLRNQKSLDFIFCRKKCAKVDDIIDIFGKWLFDYANPGHFGFEKINEVAIRILTKVFRKGRGPIKEDYLFRFYSLINDYLNKKEYLFIDVCCKLFDSDLPGVSLLYRKFIEKLLIIEKEGIRMLDDWGRNWGKGLTKFLCGYLGRYKIVMEYENLPAKDEYKYMLNNQINIVKKIFRTFDKIDNIKYLKRTLWVATINSTMNCKFAPLFLDVFKDVSESNAINSDRLRMILDLIVTVAEIYHMKKQNSLLTEDGVNDIEACVREYIGNLIKLVRKADFKNKILIENVKEREGKSIILIIQSIYLWMTLITNNCLEVKQK